MSRITLSPLEVQQLLGDAPFRSSEQITVNSERIAGHGSPITETRNLMTDLLCNDCGECFLTYDERFLSRASVEAIVDAFTAAHVAVCEKKITPPVTSLGKSLPPLSGDPSIVQDGGRS